MTRIRNRGPLLVVAALAALAASLAGLAEAADRLQGEYGTVWVTNRTLHNVTAFDAEPARSSLRSASETRPSAWWRRS